MLASYDYDAFGNQKDVVENIHNPFRYCGEYADEETGLIYLRARYYDPSIGRFITEDPAKDGLNWYVYCGGDPVNSVDPRGMDPILLSYGLDWINKTIKERTGKNANYSVSWVEEQQTAYIFKNGNYIGTSFSVAGGNAVVGGRMFQDKEKEQLSITMLRVTFFLLL